MPIFGWRCVTCGTVRDEFIPLAEVDARRPDTMVVTCDCGAKMEYQWPMNRAVSLDFPLHDAPERYQRDMETNEREEQRPIYERYAEGEERKAWDRKRDRGEGRIIV